MVMQAVREARRAARAALEATYEGTCTVVEYRNVRDEKTKISHKQEIIVVQEQPCKLSFEKLSAANQTETAARVSQGAKVFLAPEIQVNGNSKLIISQNGETSEYSASGIPAVYQTHQEIVLERFRGWA